MLPGVEGSLGGSYVWATGLSDAACRRQPPSTRPGRRERSPVEGSSSSTRGQFGCDTAAVIDDDVARQALRRQWDRIAAICERLDPDRPSRVPGWRNAEVLAHLAVQPLLLARFLTGAGEQEAEMRLEVNLAGTHALAEAIDSAARDAARAGRTDFARNAIAVDQSLANADLSATITTLQGPIQLADYVRSRCIEAVVHGCDLQPAVEADQVAQAVAAESLMTLLRSRPEEFAVARELPGADLIDMATGRTPATVDLAHVMPLMS